MHIVDQLKYFDPFSKEFERATRNFHALPCELKFVTIFLTITAGFATLFLGGVGAFATFRGLVDTWRAKKIKISGKSHEEKTANKANDLGKKILNDKNEPLFSQGVSFGECIKKLETSLTDGQPLSTDFFFEETLYDQFFQQYVQTFKKDINYKENSGFIEKVDVDPKSQIFVRADLHGDLSTLVANILALRQLNLLDEDFKCKKGVLLVFLGDYMDRGNFGLDTLFLLTKLRMENPEQVYLIRGDHENFYLNLYYSGNDAHFQSYTAVETRENLLTEVYQTMPLTLYVAESTDSSPKEYMQFTHGLFELSVDAAPLVDSNNISEFMPVSLIRKPSKRISMLAEKMKNFGEDAMAEPALKKNIAAQRIVNLIETDAKLKRAPTDSTYIWGDVSTNKTKLGDVLKRHWKLSTDDIKHYIRVSSANNKVKMILRGHEHAFKHHKHNEKVVVTTLPVSTDGHYKEEWSKDDRGYILKTDPQVKNWTKTALTRERGFTKTNISEEMPLTSADI